MNEKYKIMIAQIDDVDCKHIEDSLSGIGYYLYLCKADGGTIVSLAKSYQPDLIIMPANMNNGDAISVINILERIYENVKFLVLSYGENDFMKECLKSNRNCDFLQKPTIGSIIQSADDILKASKDVFTEKDIKIKISQTNKDDLESIVTCILHDIGLSSHLSGFRFVRYAIMLVVADGSMMNSVTKIIYPEVAKKFGDKPSNVERTIRHAIDKAWSNNKSDRYTKYFNYTNEKRPTNAEFIATISDTIRLKFPNIRTKIM